MNQKTNFYYWWWSNETIKVFNDYKSTEASGEKENAIILKGNLTSRIVTNHYGFICEQQRKDNF